MAKRKRRQSKVRSKKTVKKRSVRPRRNRIQNSSTDDFVQATDDNDFISALNEFK